MFQRARIIFCCAFAFFALMMSPQREHSTYILCCKTNHVYLLLQYRYKTLRVLEGS